MGARDFAFHRSVSADRLYGTQILSGRLGQRINLFVLPEIDPKFIRYQAGNLVNIPNIFLC
jgi:hypothetical protein